MIKRDRTLRKNVSTYKRNPVTIYAVDPIRAVKRDRYIVIKIFQIGDPVAALKGRCHRKDMRTPYDSLDDFRSSIAATPEPAEPPPLALLRFTGEFEVLKPLVSSEDFAEHLADITDTLVPPAPGVHWFLGFRRSLALVGSLAFVALVLGSAIFIGTYPASDESADSRSDAAVDQQSEDTPAQPDQQPGDISASASDLSGPSAPASSPSISDEPRGSLRPRVLRAVYRPRSIARRPQIMRTSFVPTTLVIYAEKGEIKTRIEPQLTSSYEKSLTLPN